MIQVQKSDKPIPAGLSSPSAIQQNIQLLIDQNAHTANGGIYAHASVKAALRIIYNKKCAYCESLIPEQADRQVDHYRPKKAREKGEDQHPGYFWLTYEWSNLLLSCDTCNGKKSTKFPVDGTRVTTPPTNQKDWELHSTPMTGEQPLLLNPEVDDPSDHLCFFPDGQIHSKNKSLRGAKTIDVCKLDRQELTIERKKLIDKFRDDLRDQAFLLLDQRKQGHHKTPEEFKVAMQLGFEIFVKKIKNAEQTNQPFSLLGKLVNQETDLFLLAGIPAGNPRNIVRKALQRFL